MDVDQHRERAVAFRLEEERRDLSTVPCGVMNRLRRHGVNGPGPGGRGTTQGAFGRPGGRPVRGRKSKRAKRQEFEQQGAPSLGGVQVPRGDGTTEVQIRAGASLADFADKIDANPAALVTVLFHLGEMATATQSLDEDTFQALGAELGYQVEAFTFHDSPRRAGTPVATRLGAGPPPAARDEIP